MTTDKLKVNRSPRSFFLELVPIVLANMLISLVISFPLFKSGNQDNSLYYTMLGLLPFISHYFSLNLIIGLFTYSISFILPRKAVIFLRTSLFFLLQIILLVDTRIYEIFHYHINPLVLNVITTEGASDSIILGKGTVSTFLVWLFSILLIETGINLSFGALAWNVSEKKSTFIRKSVRAIFITGLCLILAEKGMFAYADLVNSSTLTKNAKLYPLYQPLTVKGFAAKVFHMKISKEENFGPSVAGAAMKYPKEKLLFDPSKDKKYNIIIIAVEGLRSDNLDKDIMPNIWEFGQKSIIYRNHYSGGNGSRFGIFSLLYGIEGTYWHTFLAHRTSPVLIDTLMEKGYDFRVLSSTSLTFPEFRKTAFVKIPENIEDTYTTNDSVIRDRIMTDSFTKFASTRKAGKPFFAFMFYNSSHQTYNYPKSFEKFLPVLNEELNYFKDTGKDKIFMLRNRYRNAVFYEDFLIGKVITSLKDNHLLDDSIVVITGDHGEEFLENGYFGHTSSFDDYQTKTVFVLHYPKAKPHTVEKITSHGDLVPTLMESLGCTSPFEDYSQGIPLISSATHPYITSANWDNAAIIDNEYKIIFSTELYNMGTLEVRKKNDYSLVGNQKEIIKQKRNIFFDIAKTMSEFYRK